MEQGSSTSGSGEGSKKRRKMLSGAAVAIVVVVMLIVAMVLFAPKVQVNSTKENMATIIHLEGGEVVYLNSSMSIKNANGGYALGQDLVFTITYANTNASNTVSILGFAANTPGFAFKSCTPGLPIENLPIQPNVTSVELRFTAPSNTWSGQFEFTVYFEQYPLG
ncbi:MAG: hypothetical protein WCK39_08310 [Methanomassiliicoccales archaeon]